MDNTLCKTCGKLIPKKNFARHQLSHSEEKKSLHKGYNSIRMVTTHSLSVLKIILKLGTNWTDFGKMWPLWTHFLQNVILLMQNVKVQHRYVKNGVNYTLCSFRKKLDKKKFIREKKGFMNTMLRLEHEEEHLHQIMNSLENRFKAVYNKTERYFLILKELENKHYSK